MDCSPLGFSVHGDSPGKNIVVGCHFLLQLYRIQVGLPSVAQLVKNLPAMQETPVRFLGQQDILEKGWATHSSIHGLPWWLRW